MKVNELKSLIKAVIREVVENVKEDHGLGYGHNLTWPTSLEKERDPLNDPMLTGKNEVVTSALQYKFHDFKWLGNMAGFGVPTDIHYGSTFLGTIESEADGYVIRLVDTPHGKVRVEQGAKNKFKSKNLAADALHKLWKWARK